MARKEKEVTRTIVSTAVNCLCINTETCEPENKVFVMSGEIQNNEKTLTALRKKHETPTLKIASIVAIDVKEKLYAMSEEDFIAHAEERDPRVKGTGKLINH